MELFKGITLIDVFVVLVGLGIAALCAVSSLPYRWVISVFVIGLFGMLIVRVNGDPIYVFFWNMLKYRALPRRFYRVFDDKALKNMKGKNRGELVDAYYNPDEQDEEKNEQAEDASEQEEKSLKEIIREENKILKSKTATKEEKDAVWLARANRSAEKKKQKAKGKENTSEYSDISDFMPFTDIKDGFIDYAGEYYGTVIEIDPIEFRFHSVYRRTNAIEGCFGKVIRSLTGQYGVNIVKLQRPIMYDRYLEAEYQKLEALRKSYESGLIREDELKARIEVEHQRIAEISDLCTENQVIEGFYYLVIFDRDKRNLKMITNQALDSLEQAELQVRRLDDRGLAIFLKYSNALDFDEREIDEIDPERWVQWAMPEKLKFSARRVEVNGMLTHNFRVIKYPSVVGDAWLAGVMSFPGTKVVVKVTPMDRSRAIRSIDRSLAELRGRYVATGIDSKRLELQTHIETLSTLLVTLQQENEALLSVNIYITAYDSLLTKEDPLLGEKFMSRVPMVPDMKKTVRHTWTEAGMKLSQMDFLQLQSFIGSQISNYDPLLKEARGIPSNTIAGMYPWIFAHISDEGGVKLGSSDGVPVFIDFFRRDTERVNSNMVIVGKSGSGKSFTTKSLLLNLASEDAKIFILDPENEYSELAHNLHGRIINVGNAKYGRLNPFHIITALGDDEAGESGGPAGSFATHLQFLEEFFRQILPDIDKDALEYLNSLVERTYLNFGITAETDLSVFRAEDYPIFDDLYDVILAEFERTNNDYLRQLLRTLVNYVSKFSTGGRNANIWNGVSTITTDENFSVFNFQSLLANRNSTIANAQMLLVLKYIDNEIIKNRDYNLRYGLNRKVVVVIDEAHVFIDTKFPIALDFMFQLAKRIRKYNGMQIVITQNIKDFVGSEEIARKSTAIINACQYSFVFGLAPNDMDDLCRLYEKAGGINEQEQEDILSAKRGQAFAIMSPTSRSSFHIDVPELFRDMFENMDYESLYFAGEEGDQAWEEFIEDSRELHDSNYDERKIYEEEHPGLEENNWYGDGMDGGSLLNFSEITEEEALALDQQGEMREAPVSAVDKMIAAEEAVNRREYELATGRFGGIRLEEVDGFAADSYQGETYGGGNITFSEEPEDAGYGQEAYGGYEEDASGQEAYGGYEEDASGQEAYGGYAAGAMQQEAYGGYAAAAPRQGADVPVYTQAMLDQKLNEFRMSIRAEMEQELIERLKWISIGAGLGAGAATGQQPYVPTQSAAGTGYAGTGSAAPAYTDRAYPESSMTGEETYGAAYAEEAYSEEGYADDTSGEEAYTDDTFEEEGYADDTFGEASEGAPEETIVVSEDELFGEADLAGEPYDEESGEEPDEDLGDESDDEYPDELSEEPDEDLDEEVSVDADSIFGEDLSDDPDEDLDEEISVDAGSIFGEDLSDDLDEDLDEEISVDADSIFGEDLSGEPDEDLSDDEYEDEKSDMNEDTDDFDFDLDDDPDLDEDGEFDDDEFSDDDIFYDEDEDEDDDDEFEHTPFLFAELLEEAAEEYANMDLDERMEESGELVMNITLDELSQYIRDLHKKKKGA